MISKGEEMSDNPALAAAASSPNLQIHRSDHHSNNNPNCPTTFVHADTSSFKHVVQMLTGSPHSQSSNPNPPPHHHHHHQDLFIPNYPKPFPIPPIRKQGFKLYERRSNLKNNALFINTIIPNSGLLSPRSSNFINNKPPAPEILSPSILDFPSLTLASPVTPLKNDDAEKSSSASEEEERAIAEKGFYLHPSPITTPRDSEPPRLLTLFPLTSPRASDSSSPTNSSSS